MRRFVIPLVGAIVLFGACSTDKRQTATTSTTTTSTTTTAVSTSPAATTTTGAVATSSAVTTTTAACPAPNTPTAPITTGAGRVSALLRTIEVKTGAPCADVVSFAFVTKTSAAPSCRVEYRSGPFVSDASGARVAVAGAAFVVVRCAPASGYDFETGRAAYTGPKRIEPAPAHFVREVVQIGDNEGVLTWVVGLDATRPCHVTVSTLPSALAPTLTLTFA